MARKPRKKVVDPIEVEVIEEIRTSQLIGEIEPYIKTFKMGECFIILAWSVEEGWHLSISTNYRYPSWDEIAHARYSLLPDDVHMGLPLPPSKQYISLHHNCFHLHEMPVRGRPYKMSEPPGDYEEVTNENTLLEDVIRKAGNRFVKD